MSKSTAQRLADCQRILAGRRLVETPKLELDIGVVLTIAGLLTRLGNLDRASGSADLGAEEIAAELLRLVEANRIATLRAFVKAHHA